MFFDHYPYTNFHNVNMDWLLQAVKAWGKTVEANDRAFRDLKEANEDFKKYVRNYLQDLDITDEINTKLDNMLASGILTPYFAPYVRGYVDSWLASHVTPTSPALDSTLTLSGAAARADSTGHRLKDLAYIDALSTPEVIAALNRSQVLPGYRVQGIAYDYDGHYYVCGGSVDETGTGVIVKMTRPDFTDAEITEIPQLGHANDITYYNGYLYVCTVGGGNAPRWGIYKINVNDFTDKTLISNAPENTIGISYRQGDFWILAPYRIYRTTDFTSYEVVVANTNDLLTAYGIPTSGRISQTIFRAAGYLIGWVCSFVFEDRHYGALTFFSASGEPIAFKMFPAYHTEIQGAVYADMSIYLLADGNMVNVFRMDPRHLSYVQLKAGDDLNSFTGRGTLYSTGSNVSSALLNSPSSGEGFTVQVDRLGVYNTIQTARTNSGRELYRIKSFNSDTWGEWIEPAAEITQIKEDLNTEATYRQSLGQQIADNNLVTLVCPCVLEIANTTIDTSTGKRISMTGLTTRYYETGYASDDVVLSYYSKYAFYNVLPDTQAVPIEGVHVGPGTNVNITLVNGTKFIGIATPSNIDAPVVKTISRTGKLTKWVSPNGNDGNEGTKNSPLATVNTALQSGASVVMLARGVYNQQIDLSYAKNPNVELRCGEPYNKVIFKDPDSVLATSETKVSNTTKVYSATVTASINANNNWIYQEGIADAATLILDAERHPLERGYVYRCEDTMISKCTSDNATDALAEIDSSDNYKWFLDTDNSTLYFSRPQPVSAEHPICYSTGKTLFSNGSKSVSLKAVGIETKYMAFNINDLSFAELLECKSSNVFGDGAFVYDRCQSSKFVRCEAARCQKGVSGDGFNGHSTNSGDTYSKQTNTTLINCWAHDNNDDGYSDHERCEVSLLGGLYEYNHKGGVMPSYGSHCMCYDVLSRNNYNGFYCAGEATVAEGGKGTQMWCYNCIAENNEVPGVNYGSGFVVSQSGNSAVLINCKAISNELGYSCFNTAAMKIIDCSGRLNTSLKAGTIEISNTTIVE